VSVVVLNWNGLEDTRECVRSLLAQRYPALEIHVVDNASDHREADRIETEFGGYIRLHRNDRNLGFTGGNHTAMAVALAEGRARYVALLNNDAVAEPGWVDALVEVAERRPEVGQCASLMLFYDDPDKVENAGIELLGSGDAVPRGRGQRRERFRRAAEVIGACGGAVLYRAAMLRQVGLFEEDFFANFEDVDLSLRALRAGWRCVYVPDAVVRHRLNRSIRKARNEEFNVRSLRNLYLATRANLPFPVRLVNAPWVLLRDLVLCQVTPWFGQAGIARTVRLARAAMAQRLPELLRARAGSRMAPGAAWRIWRLQRSFLPAWWRFFVEAVLLRRRGFLE
jgi:GT2 family glycosyltransferase